MTIGNSLSDSVEYGIYSLKKNVILVYLMQIQLDLPQIMNMYFVGIINITNATTSMMKIARRLRKGTVKLNRL